MNTTRQIIPAAVNSAGRIETQVPVVQQAEKPRRIITDGNTPMALSGLVAASAAWDAEFSETRLNADDLQFVPEGVRYGEQFVRMDQTGRTRLLNNIGAPGRYFERHNPAFQAAALTEHAALGDFG